jgi:hypothetical protein
LVLSELIGQHVLPEPDLRLTVLFNLADLGVSFLDFGIADLIFDPGKFLFEFSGHFALDQTDDLSFILVFGLLFELVESWVCILILRKIAF